MNENGGVEDHRRSGHRLVLVAATVPISVRVALAPQIAELACRGYRVEVVTSPGDDSLAALPGVSAVHQLPMTRTFSPLADVRALNGWLRLIRRFRPEVVIAFSPKAALLCMLVAWVARVPTRIYTTGGLRLETARGPALLVLWLTEWVTCVASTRVVANSPSLARRYSRYRIGRRKMSWTMSRKGVDTTHFDMNAATATGDVAVSGPSDLPVVGFVGRVTRDKGILVLAAALKRLQREDCDVRLVVVGPAEGADAPAILEELKRCTPHLTVVGSVDDVRPYYRAMHLLVLPSEREGFPNVVLEAAAMGLPAVVSDATGCVDSVVHGMTGLHFTAGDDNELADAMCKLVADEELRLSMGRAARQRAVTDFDPARVVAHQLHQMGMGGPACAE